jgi:predicted nuclease with TOPRIM domain
MEKKLVAAVTKIAALETSLSELQLVNRNIEGSPVVGEVPSEVTSDVPNSNHGDQEKEQLLLSLQEEYGKEKAMLEQELSLVKEQHSLSIQKCEKLERRNTELEEEMSSAKEEYLKARGML